MKPLLIIGNYLSPYVRKVLLCLELKGIAYEVDPLVPFYGNDAFSRLSPLRRIPVLIDGDLVLTDSSVICEYLEDLRPEPALYPADIRDRARARWLEEFALAGRKIVPTGDPASFGQQSVRQTAPDETGGANIGSLDHCDWHGQTR